MQEFFSQQEFGSRWEYYQDFTSLQDSHWDPGGDFFSWWDPSKYRFLGKILAEMYEGNFSREGSRQENRLPWWDPSECQESWNTLREGKLHFSPA